MLTKPQGGLARYRSSVTSQDGEDGIIGHIFSRIPIASRICVEFGAWDGKYLSNTWDLWHNQGWTAVLIEANPVTHAALAASTADNPNVHAVLSRVSGSGPSSVDAVLSGLGMPTEIDLVSIDVDGDELAIWEGVKTHRPSVVVVEHNSTIPPHIAFEVRGPNYVGSSARSLVQAGKRLGYELVACTMTNCIFVKSELYPLLGLDSNELEDLFDYQHLTWVISSYRGDLVLTRRPLHHNPGLKHALRSFAQSAVWRLLPRRDTQPFGVAWARLRGPRIGSLLTLRSPRD